MLITQCNEKDAQKSTEVSSLFLKLDEGKQDSVLQMLKALEFAQSILCDKLQKTSGQDTYHG